MKDSLTRAAIIIILALMCLAIIYELSAQPQERRCLINGEIVNCDTWTKDNG